MSVGKITSIISLKPCFYPESGFLWAINRCFPSHVNRGGLREIEAASLRDQVRAQLLGLALNAFTIGWRAIPLAQVQPNTCVGHFGGGGRWGQIAGVEPMIPAPIPVPHYTRLV